MAVRCYLCQKRCDMGPNHNYCYEYPRPALTADCVLFSFEKHQLHVLLIERKYEPFKGMWAFPGGFMDMDENTDQCVLRELKEETGLENITVEQLGTFSDVNRDPRGRTVTVAYWAMARQSACKPVAGDDAQSVKWFPINHLPPLAFDHRKIFDAALIKMANALKIGIRESSILPDFFADEDIVQIQNTVAEYRSIKPNGSAPL